MARATGNRALERPAAPASVEPREQILKFVEDARFSVQVKGLAQRFADPGVNRRARRLHEPTGLLKRHFAIYFHLFHEGLT